MSDKKEIKVPAIGDFVKVPVVEVLVAMGDVIKKDQSLITLESDKATMEVPAPFGGRIAELKVTEGDEVSEGDVIALVEAASESKSEPAEEATSEEPSQRDPESGPRESRKRKTANDRRPTTNGYDCDLLVLGSGPGGYTAAFRAADLGLDVVLVERYPDLGGVCLNVGCIPSKALLHVGRVIDEARHFGKHGVKFSGPEIDLDALRGFKDGTVKKLTGGLVAISKKRKVRVVQGLGAFLDANTLGVENDSGKEKIRFRQAIIAAGSRVMKIDGIPWDDERVMDSTAALELAEIPDKLLVIGGGIIGTEMACIYRALGSRVTVVELMDQLMPGTDRDLVKPLHKHLESLGVEIHLKTRVVKIDAAKNGFKARLEGEDAAAGRDYDRILVAVGRKPNGDSIGADAAGVEVDEKGFVKVDGELRTSRENIFAIGDVIGHPLLAHKASYEGKVAAEVAAGKKRVADARAIPSVAYTDPEVAWVGLTESEAKKRGLEFGIGKFPWAASGRALGMDRPEGFTKLVFDKKSGRLIGAGIVGAHAGDLIAELALAIEMGCDAADIGMTVHPHPTLSESIMMAAEVFEGTITDLYLGKRKSET